MLGRTEAPPNNNNNVIHEELNNKEDGIHAHSEDTSHTRAAPNRGTGLGLGNLEPLIGGNLLNDEQGTLQYLSQLETVARRLKDQLLQDKKKVHIH